MEDKFREIYEKSPIGIIFHDKEGIAVNANDSALKIMAISELDDILGINLFDNPFIVDKREELLKEGIIRFQAPLDLDIIKNLGFYYPTKNGVLFLDYTVSLIDSDFLVQIQDITEHKKAEKALRESEQKYRALFSSTPDYTLLIGMDGTLIEVNEAARKITGLSEEDLIGKNFTDLKLLLDEEIPLHMEKVSQLLERKKCKTL